MKPEKIKKVNDVKCLVVSSTIDYSTDLICYGLEKNGIEYLRINRDRFSSYKIIYSLEDNSLNIKLNNKNYCISPEKLKSIYFRSPVFLRSSKHYTLEEQLYRSQWSAFTRNLILFNNVKWINHPVATYQAENKLYQLKCAKQLGFDVPKTYVCNSLPKDICDEREYIVKSLDTALFYNNDEEMFTYSTIVTGKEMKNSEIKSAPVIIQNYLENKVDLRVTIVNKRLFAVSITKNGNPVYGDWRKLSRDNLSYKPIELPFLLQKQIFKLMDLLKLSFGGLDFALVNGKYYFIEINPTGEWGWLISSSNQSIDKEIVNSLIGDKHEKNI